MYVIDPNGNGDFTSLQAAVDAVNGGGRAPVILLVRPGEYHERVIVNKDNLRIIGEDAEKTVVTWSACALDKAPDGTDRGTFLSFTMLVTGCNVEIENLTVRNDAGDGRQVGQAVALYAAGDRGTYRRCRLIAHQDTLFCGPMMEKVTADILPRASRAEEVPSVGDCPLTRSREYFEDCFIQGDVDFIFGPYRCYFERCTLFMNERGGWYTAANTPQEQPYGLVFHRCRLTGACGTGAAFLGRPWRKFARTVFLDCEMDEHVAPQGFADWNEEKKVTDRYAERGTLGADMARRHPAEKMLMEAEAACISMSAVLGGCDNWRPDQRNSTWFLCGDSTMADYIPSRYPMMGWGQKLPGLVPENEFVENCAVNGRSSRSFLEEGRLDRIIPCLRPGDHLVASFCHNDEKDDPKRHTDADTTYPDCLTQYIDAARSHGAEPILATPIARRHFDDAGRLIPTHGPYPDAMRRLAKRLGVRLIDLEKITMDLFQQMGPEDTPKVFCHLPRGSAFYPDGAADDTHLQERGAALVASLFWDRYASGREEEKDFGTISTRDDFKELIDKEDSVMDC